MRGKHVCIMLCTSLLLAACGRSKDAQFFLLNPITPIAKNQQYYSSLTIGIDEIRTPAYTEKPQIMIRQSTNQVTLEEYYQWAETLDKTIKRIIQANLSNLLPKAVIEHSPWDIKFTPKYHLQVNLTQFTVDKQGNSLLSANYFIFDHEKIIKKQTVYYHLHVAPPSIENLVASMNDNLNHLTRDMANTFRSLP